MRRISVGRLEKNLNLFKFFDFLAGGFEWRLKGAIALVVYAAVDKIWRARSNGLAIICQIGYFPFPCYKIYRYVTYYNF